MAIRGRSGLIGQPLGDVLRSMLLMLAVSVFVVVLDQASKAVVAARIPEGTFTSRDILGIRLHHVLSRRFPWRSRSSVLPMSIVWLLGTSAALLLATRVDRTLVHLALGTLVGGATGNLLDASLRNAVTDFIDLRVWPVFNIADTAIVIGAELLLSTLM